MIKGKVLENCRKSCSVCVVSTTPTKVWRDAVSLTNFNATKLPPNINIINTVKDQKSVEIKNFKKIYSYPYYT